MGRLLVSLSQTLQDPGTLDLQRFQYGCTGYILDGTIVETSCHRLAENVSLWRRAVWRRVEEKDSYID